MHILIPTSPGELIDKITILEVKLSEFSDVVKIANVKNELELLVKVMDQELERSSVLDDLRAELKSVNKKIWDTENDVREFWNDDERFIEAARSSHYNNDERARVKSMINELLGSKILEEKSHPKYTHEV